jgi:hypothetical protein
MISRYEVSQVINDALNQKIRGLRPYSDCFNLDLSLNMYTSVHDLTTLAKNAATTHDMTLLKQCLTVAVKLYKDGERLVQDVVENIFIYELSSKVSKVLLPKVFYNVYLKQVMNSN